MAAAVLAPRCAACNAPLAVPSSGPVCIACWNGVRVLKAPLCVRCGDEAPSWRTARAAGTPCAHCLRRPSAVDAARAAAAYDGTLRHVIHAFKYDGRRTLATRLAAMMRDAGAEMLQGASCVIPVPLHPLRRLSRGFNQAHDLARRLDRPIAHALWRVRATVPQEHLTAANRRRNVRGAFRLSPLLTRAARARLLHGRIVVLVDDVRTTGATLDQCAAVLKAAGVREVRALTVAIAPPHRRRDP